MDATYRSDLREINELNFARFDAKLEQRLAEVRTALEKGLKEQTRWMFLAWATILIPIIGLWMRR
jgi:hypothetical protein